MTNHNMKEFKVVTCTIQQMKNMKQKGYVPIDITVKSAEGFWRDAAPSWDMVMGYKNGTLSAEAYTGLYIPIMKKFFARNRYQIIDFLRNNNKIALACYCRQGDFCHRELLAMQLKRFIFNNEKTLNAR